jgi:hypothetical protein
MLRFEAPAPKRPETSLKSGLFRGLATSGCLEHKMYLYHLAPERGFIAPEPLEDASVEIGKPLEAMRQIS